MGGMTGMLARVSCSVAREAPSRHPSLPKYILLPCQAISHQSRDFGFGGSFFWNCLGRLRARVGAVFAPPGDFFSAVGDFSGRRSAPASPRPAPGSSLHPPNHPSCIPGLIGAEGLDFRVRFWRFWGARFGLFLVDWGASGPQKSIPVDLTDLGTRNESSGACLSPDFGDFR